MKTFETSGTVREQGRVLVAGVPFAPGSEVEITISPKRRSDDEGMPADDKALAAALTGAHSAGRRDHALHFDGNLFANAKFAGLSGATTHTIAFWAKMLRETFSRSAASSTLRVTLALDCAASSNSPKSNVICRSSRCLAI